MIVGMALMGLTFGPMSAILAELFPTETRYTGSGIAYNVSSILGAALTPFIAAWLMGAFDVSYVGYYLAAASAITLIFLALSPETEYRSLAHFDVDEVQRQRLRLCNRDPILGGTARATSYGPGPTVLVSVAHPTL